MVNFAIVLIPLYWTMLTIFNLLTKKEIIRTTTKKGQSVRAHKRDIPANKEWYNSIYAFTKNSTRFLPAVHNSVFKLIRDYFNMTNENMVMKKKSWARTYNKTTRTTGNKIWVSTPEIKHYSERINITIYLYNRLYSSYKRKLDHLSFRWGPELELRKKSSEIFEQTNDIKTYRSSFTKDKQLNPDTFVNKHNNSNVFVFRPFLFSYYRASIQPRQVIFNAKRSLSTDTINNKFTESKEKMNFNLTKKLKLLRRNYPTYLGKKKKLLELNQDYYIWMIKWLKWDKLSKLEYFKSTLTNATDNKELTKELTFMKMERYNYLINQFKKELTYLKYKQKILFTEFKFNEVYLTPLIEFLQSIYKKNIDFNLVMLKHYYLSTSILSQIIITKLKKAKARGRPLSVVDAAISRIKLPTLSNTKLQKVDKKHIHRQNIVLANFKTKLKEKDNLNQFLLTRKWKSDRDIHKLALKNIENKAVAGIFIKISGRLTKRYKAQRAVSKLRARGTLQNVHSAHQGFSSSLSRGYSNINVEKTMSHSKNRIGAYGLTNWIASY